MSNKEEIKTLLEAGAHFGHRTSRWNPKMRDYIHSSRGGIHIIDLIQTAEKLREASEFAKKTAGEDKKILYVGTKKHTAPAVEEAAQKAGMPYVTQRWFGGILTNFDTISERVKYFKKISQQLESGELAETYNKREIAQYQEEKDKMEISFGGLVDMDKLPGALFVSDVVNEKTAVREANRLGIPVIAIVDSNGDPEPIDYVIPANDDAVKTVALIADGISEAVLAGVESRGKKPANKASADQTKDKAEKKPSTNKEKAESEDSTKTTTKTATKQSETTPKNKPGATAGSTSKSNDTSKDKKPETSGTKETK